MQAYILCRLENLANETDVFSAKRSHAARRAPGTASN